MTLMLNLFLRKDPVPTRTNQSKTLPHKLIHRFVKRKQMSTMGLKICHRLRLRWREVRAITKELHSSQSLPPLGTMHGRQETPYSKWTSLCPSHSTQKECPCLARRWCRHQISSQWWRMSPPKTSTKTSPNLASYLLSSRSLTISRSERQASCCRLT